MAIVHRSNFHQIPQLVIALFIVVVLPFQAYGQETDAPSKPLVERMLSREEQAALTPTAVLEALKQGNERFTSGRLTTRDILGSMEFATKVAGAKLVFVLGHESCGAGEIKIVGGMYAITAGEVTFFAD